MSKSSSSSSVADTTASAPPPPDQQQRTDSTADVEDAAEQVVVPPPPPTKYTLKQAFYRAYNSTLPRHENDMLLTEIPREDKRKLIDYYEYANNPSPHVDKYYTQYHAFELVVFKKHAAETWDAIVKFFKDSQQLSKRYSKNLSYMLQKQRQCLNSYSTIILLVIAYPRHRQKNKEVSEQFIIDSGLKSHFPTWGISACKSYAYLSPEEYIKLLNTHAEGCFVSHIYPRFRAFTDEWESRMIRRRHDDDDDDDDDSSSFTSEEDDDDCCDGGDDSSTTTTTSSDGCSSSSSSSSSDDDDDAAAAAAATVTDSDEEDGEEPEVVPPSLANTTRRFFSPPHPSLAAAPPASCATKHRSSAKLSSPRGLKGGDDGTSSAAVSDRKKTKMEKRVTFCHSSSPKPPRPRHSQPMIDRFYRATGFMSHANCGLHKLTVVAKDIHKHTNTLIFHRRSFDRRCERNVVRSKDYLLPHHHSGGGGGGASRHTNNNNNRKRKLMAIAAATQHTKKKMKKNDT